jgi:hypothetical protein
VESEQDQQGAEEKDLGHQGLDDAALIADYQGDDQYEYDDYVDDHRSGAILEDRPRHAFSERIRARVGIFR